MEIQDRIVVDPDILVGKPCVKGTRLSVDFLLGLMAQGWICWPAWRTPAKSWARKRYRFQMA